MGDFIQLFKHLILIFRNGKYKAMRHVLEDRNYDGPNNLELILYFQNGQNIFEAGNAKQININFKEAEILITTII